MEADSDLSSLTPELFDTASIVVIIFGVALAIVRLYAEFTRRLPPDDLDDTQQNHIAK